MGLLEQKAVSSDVLVMNAALTGMVPTRQDSPFVPLTAEEVAADAWQAWEAGARVVHLHPRDEAGAPTTNPDTYRRLIAAVRERCPEMLISATCSGRCEGSLDARAVPLSLEDDLKPDLASLTCGSLNFPLQASVNTLDTITELARRMQEAGVKPELEVFEPGMINTACYLLDRGLLQPPLYANILLGNLGTCPASPMDLGYLIAHLPAGTVWSATGIGRFQLPVQTMALAAGGHVRVGLEDCLYYDYRDRRPATNRQLIERVARIAAELGRRPATAEEARHLLQLPEAAR